LLNRNKDSGNFSSELTLSGWKKPFPALQQGTVAQEVNPDAEMFSPSAEQNSCRDCDPCSESGLCGMPNQS
jgi:hypothetical protein